MEFELTGKDAEQKKNLAGSGGGTNYGACSSADGLAKTPTENENGEKKRPVHWIATTKLFGGDKESEEAGGEKKEEEAAQKPDDVKVVIESSDSSPEQKEGEKKEEKKEVKIEEVKEVKKEETPKPSNRTKSSQRWLKLRTTVQLSGAIQKSKAPLKREDSFLKRFSTRQRPDTQEIVSIGEEENDVDDDGGPLDQDEVNRRRLRLRRMSSKFVVNPDQKFYFIWLMIVTACVLYNLWAVIVRQCFPELQDNLFIFWFICDGVTDLVFWSDIFVQLRTGYLEQGLMVYDWRKLSGHYVKSKDFILDVVAIIPLDLIQFRTGSMPIIRFPRFLKTYRLCHYYYMVEARTVYPNVWRVVNLVHILLMLAHWFGCFYFLLSEAEGFKGDWVYPLQPGDTLLRKYLGSLYWSTLTLTTIGDLPTPETNYEFVFTIVSYLFGMFIFATIVGQVGNIITNRNANRLEFERILDGAKTYMRYHKVPGDMKKRVLRWYDYSWSRGRIQGGGDINTALRLLPDKLKTELALHVNLRVLKKVTIFQQCQPAFLHDLVLKMRAFIFTPGDLICRKGEVAREMFIIADGILDVIGENGRLLTTMKAGDFFGEIGILNLDGYNKRTADVRSVGYAELFSLAREDVLRAIDDYPEAEVILQALGRKRLMEVKKANLYARKGKGQGSSAESEAEKKTIVNKIRSDVKGLKDALRRSRRGANSRSKMTRMSHVDSSDCDEPPHSPIGAGLPLLQRVKMMKEKQEKEKEAAAASQKETKEEKDPKDLLKQDRGDKNENKTKVTVHTQQTGVRFEDGKKESVAVQTHIQELNNIEGEANEKPEPVAKKESGRLFRDALKKLQPKPASEGFEPKPFTSEANLESFTPEEKTTAAHKSKDSWGLLKSSSIRSVKAKKTSYLSKSYTILERKSQEDVKDKRSRSASPSTGSDTRKSLKGAVKHMIKEKRRTKSLSQAPKRSCQELADVNAWEFSDPAFSQVEGSEPETGNKCIKKYDSVDDLSPEHSGLPFVTKLKILNEKQSVTADPAVRSMSQDVPERSTDDPSLIRSQSEASAIQRERSDMETPAQGASEEQSYPSFEGDLPSDCIRRSETIIERSSEQTYSPLLSPESNETWERRRLKTLLRKISADDTEGTSRQEDVEEMKKLLEAPTIEGYAARRSKLSKSANYNLGSSSSTAQFDIGLEQPSSIFDLNSLQDENDIFQGVISGIKQVMQKYIIALEQKYKSRLAMLEEEINKRDAAIEVLEKKLQNAQMPDSEKKTESPSDAQPEEVPCSPEERQAREEREEKERVINEKLRRRYSEPIRSAAGTSEGIRRSQSAKEEIRHSEPTNNETFDGTWRRRHHEIEMHAMPCTSKSNDEYWRRRATLGDNQPIMPSSYGTKNDYLRRTCSEEEIRRNPSLNLEESESEDEHDNWEAIMVGEELEKLYEIRTRQSLNEIDDEVDTIRQIMESTDLSRLSPDMYDALSIIIDTNEKKIKDISLSSVFDFKNENKSRTKDRTKRYHERNAHSLDLEDLIQRKERTLKRRHSKSRRTRSTFSLPSRMRYFSGSFQGTSLGTDSFFEEEEEEEDEEESARASRSQPTTRRSSFASTVGYLRRFGRRVMSAVSFGRSSSSSLADDMIKLEETEELYQDDADDEETFI